jgi:alpha-D-ribose 1-methylphosphonate 5-triphosphate diphosphatase
MTSTSSETVIGNARIVLADRVIERGWIAFADGRVAGYGDANAPAVSADAGGDLIMPGLIELHTDHLEAHYVPRPKVFWDPIAAVVSYDGQLATAGITTVLDSLRVWREDGAEEVDGRAGVLAEAIAAARDANLLRSDHFLHLRCEIPMPSVVEEAKELIGRPDVRLMSLMDHTPGQRQFRNEAKLRDYYRGKGPGMTDAELDILFERRFAYQKAHAATNMREIVALAIPSSLLMAALQLPQRVPAIDLASAIQTVTKTRAEAVGLADRGEIAIGKRADLIRVHVARDVPVVRSVWREGYRVA